MDKRRGGIRLCYFTVYTLGIENIVWLPYNGLRTLSDMLSFKVDRLNTASQASHDIMP